MKDADDCCGTTVFGCFPGARRKNKPAKAKSPPPVQHLQGDSPGGSVQAFYRQNRGKSCRKIMRFNGYPNKVLLYPEEGWARSAVSSYWTLTPTWWNRSKCKVVEVTGTRKYTTLAKMVDTDTGNLFIVGSFNKRTDPDFKLCLTSNVSTADFNMGYSITGSLECGSTKNNSFQTTHFAVIRRRDFDTNRP
ncbi:uncharacterized protein LOC100574537 [Acyrthosiphon pisum]|uniref:Uncharacterized protein n=1 Tax=Acyrthosiphon pisum TaxID=7029 RepID=A0A8R2A8B1_ACYPI|nr:uncharacterized protein LOC100574537 [Acyrthosiphon pisum]|eukprot:XP_003243733.1 PREDICTED: uncharacterized protein LOC100574537 [Acyrthosiphon pisum]